MSEEWMIHFVDVAHNECLWAACRDVIEDIIIPVQMRKLQAGNHITVIGRDGGMKK